MRCFNRLLQTNLYYRTYARVRTDMRFVYWISPDHPLVHVKDVCERLGQVHGALPGDPFNPNMFIQDKDSDKLIMT